MGKKPCLPLTNILDISHGLILEFILFMIFKFTCKNCRIPDRSRKRINELLNKITQILPGIESDLVVLRLTIRKNIDRYYPPRIHPHSHKTYSDSKTALAYFEGSMTFRLNKNRFYSHFKGATIDECISLGFQRIFAELERYKDLHFPSDSDYLDKRSIRGGV